MIKFLDKFLTRTNNLDYIAKGFKDLSKHTPAQKIFDSINKFSSNSEIRYVGGCVRKIIQKENVDDIDLATNLNPQQVCEALKNDNLNFTILKNVKNSLLVTLIDYYEILIINSKISIFNIKQK